MVGEASEYVCDLELIEQGLYESKLREGTYEIVLVNLGEGFKERRFQVEVIAGETTEKVIDVGGMGRLRIRLLSGMNPSSTEGRFLVYAEDGDYAETLSKYRRANYEAKLPEGALSRRGQLPGARCEGSLVDLEVFSGETTAITARIGGMDGFASGSCPGMNL